MKAFVSIITLLGILYSCTSPEYKAKKAIREELKSTLGDYKSYKPVQFGRIEEAISSYEDLPEAILYYKRAEAFIAVSGEYKKKIMDIYDSVQFRDEYHNYLEISRNALDSAQVYLNKLDSIKLHFVAEPVGWKMKHSFSAKTPGGEYELSQHEYYFDKEFTRVIKSVDLSE